MKLFAGKLFVGLQFAGKLFRGAVSIDPVLIDTHDGYWAKQWLSRKPKKKELIKAIKENPLEVVASIAEVQQEVIRVYPNINYNSVKLNIKLQQFIANQILEALQRQQDEDDEIEALFLLL